MIGVIYLCACFCKMLLLYGILRHMMALTSKPKMEKDFKPGDSENLPKMDSLAASAYLATMPKPERNAATTKSLQESYGDNAIGYVQLCRSAGLCTLKARVCLQPTVHADVTLTLNEIEEEVVHIECHDCEDAHSGCMHGAAFLLWLHRRSEEPSVSNRECFWRKPKIAEVGSKIKCITAKQLSKLKCWIPDSKSNRAVLAAFLSEAKKRKLDGPLIKYLSDMEIKEES